MYRKKDFLFMNVSNVRGKSMGFVKDLAVNFHVGGVIGFLISSYSLFQSSLYVFKEDIISFNKHMIANSQHKGKYLNFEDIRGMNVIDIRGNMIGMVEDIIFNEDTFVIQGVIVCTGYATNFLHGKKILLPKDLLLGDNHILYHGKSYNIDFINLPSKLFREEDAYVRNNKKI